jgi:hypothetical protein
MKNKKNKKLAPLLSLKDLENFVTPIDPEILKELDQEYDESRDFWEREKKDYKIEIDWNLYDEAQIQILLAILFHSVGYSVENWHKSDRAREEGADLIFRNSKESIALAVKIKPKQEDRPQVLGLLKRPEKRKIYVFAQLPSKTFYNFMKEYEGKIEFWDSDRLNSVFAKLNLGFTADLILDNQKIAQTINELRSELFSLKNKCLKAKKEQAEPLGFQSFMFLWRLKDEAVSFHKTNQNIISLLEKPINLKNKKLNEHFLTIFMKYLDELNSVLCSFKQHFTIFYEHNTNLVDNSIISEIGRSQWNHLLHYRTDNSTTSLEKELEVSIEFDNARKKFNRKYPDKEEEKYRQETAKNNDVWAVMENRVRNLMIFGAGIEEIIDDIYKEYVETFCV